MPGALTVATYTHDPIRIKCRKCERKGQYRRQTLLDRFGPDAVMPEVLVQIANCPRKGSASDPCGALYPDLRRNV